MTSESADVPFSGRTGHRSSGAPHRSGPDGARTAPLQRRTARPSARLLAAALEGVSEAVVVTGPDGLVRSLHGSARTLLPDLRPGADVTAFLSPQPEDGDTAPSPCSAADGTALEVRRTGLGEEGAIWYVTRRRPGQEEAALRAQLLGDATRRLGSPLQPERTVRLAVRLPVPRLADVCCYFARRRDGQVDWTCASTAPGHTSGRWGASAAADAAWLAPLLEGAETCAEPRAADFGAQTAGVLPEAAAGPMLALAVCGVSGTTGVLLFARGPGRPGFTDTDTDILSDYADLAGTAISAAALHQDQIRTADTLKSALLPAPLPDVDGLALGSAYRSARRSDQVGGDYYEVADTGDGVDVLFGDVSGKGGDAAVLTGLVRQSLQALRLLEHRPRRLLELLNEILLTTGSEEFTTMVLGRARRCGDGALQVEAASGGHPPPLLLRADGGVEEVPLRGMFVGAIEGAVFDTAEFTLHPGDVLLLYSDGITEARNALVDGEMFGEERLARLLASCAGMPAGAVAERVDQVVGDWLGGGPHDDIAVLALQPERDRARPVDGAPSGGERGA